MYSNQKKMSNNRISRQDNSITLNSIIFSKLLNNIPPNNKSKIFPRNLLTNYKLSQIIIKILVNKKS